MSVRKDGSCIMDIFITYVRIQFHVPGSSNSLVIEPKIKPNVYKTAMLLLYISQKMLSPQITYSPNLIVGERILLLYVINKGINVNILYSSKLLYCTRIQDLK
jgi:hypothetical protein